MSVKNYIIKLHCFKFLKAVEPKRPGYMLAFKSFVELRHSTNLYESLQNFRSLCESLQNVGTLYESLQNFGTLYESLLNFCTLYESQQNFVTLYESLIKGEIELWLVPKCWNHPSFINVSPTLVIGTWLERFSWVLQHDNLKNCLFKKMLALVFLLSLFCKIF